MNVPQTPAETAVLKTLKQNIARLPVLDAQYPSTCSDHTLLRFLRGHKLRPDEALDLLVRCGHWRRDKGVDGLIHRMETSKTLDVRFAKAYLPMGVIGRDASGRPVLLNMMSMIDFPRVLGDFGLEKAVEYGVYCNEKLLENNKLMEAIVIIDLGFGENPPMTTIMEVRTWIGSLLAFLKPFAAVGDPFYPEVFHRIFFTRAPSVFQATWKIAKTFVAEATVEKIEILGDAHSRTRLAQVLPRNVIPQFLGGSNDLRGLVGPGGKLKKGDAVNEAFVASLEVKSAGKDSAAATTLPQVNTEAAVLQRHAALDVLRNAIVAKGRLSAEAQQRGSWRFVPGLAWLESLDDDVLEKTLEEFDWNPELAVAHLSKLAVEQEMLKPVAPSSKPEKNNAGIFGNWF